MGLEENTYQNDLKSLPEKKRFHIMAKPGGSTCNIDCKYCYYIDKGDLSNGPGTGKMSDEILERYIKKYIEGNTADEVVFSWQGGEPTMLGLEYFKKIVELEKKYAKPGQRISNDLQTNGLLLDENWCKFLKENNWLVGISIDGPREIHDAYRVTKNDKPTFDLVMKAIDLLKKYRVPFNTLTCVNRLNARRPLDVYRFLRREIKSTYIQFIPIVEYKGFETTAPYKWDHNKLPIDGSPEARPDHPDSIVTDWSVDPDDYGYFLKKVFDEWRSRDLGKVLVNHFETMVAQHLGLPSQVCIYSETCGKGLAIENDGSVYSCDHFVYPEYRIGNVKDKNIDEMVYSDRQLKFGTDKSDKLPEYCGNCEYLTDCRGECPKNRIIRTPDGEPGLSYLCRGLKSFFKHTLPEVDRIVKKLKETQINPTRRMQWR
ncbi:MAG TPA: anaerobic sulfatase maturase [Ignavibacteria bacterium]|nr:anaerobic sulfatase maturase [Ignavibacteria bacterium]